MKNLIFIILIILILSGCGTNNPSALGAFDKTNALRTQSGTQKQSAPYYTGNYTENTPVVFNGKLYSFIFGHTAPNNTMDIDEMQTKNHIATIDIGTQELSCVIVASGTVYVFSSNNWAVKGNSVTMISSTDLIHWTAPITVFNDPNYAIYNISICADNQGYKMAYEIGIDNETNYIHRFATSTDLLNWKLIGNIYLGKGYAACPTIKYDVQYNKYYIFYLEKAVYGYYTNIYRTSDFINFEQNNKYPIIPLSPFDSQGEGINNSDMDLCEYQGSTYVLYAVGDQLHWVQLKLAVYPDTLNNYLRSFYAVP